MSRKHERELAQLTLEYQLTSEHQRISYNEVLKQMLGEIRNIRSEMDTMKLSYEQKLRKLKTSNHQPTQQSSRSELVIVSKIQDLL